MLYAILYTDGTLSFQKNNSITAGKTLNKSWVTEEGKPFSFNNKYDKVYWRGYGTANNIKNIVFRDKINIYNLSAYFSFMENINSINYSGLNINNVTNISYTYCRCYNFTGHPVCGNNVINMSFTYWYCNNLTGNPVCGSNVTDMSSTY
uniref:hypothetical protein n=1 Tax=Dialister succinatiphilus TaxID=487173 RepID=UPI004028FC94